ncbi:hypothetical protein Tco_0452730 [Tanacetum coccineum]
MNVQRRSIVNTILYDNRKSSTESNLFLSTQGNDINIESAQDFFMELRKNDITKRKMKMWWIRLHKMEKSPLGRNLLKNVTSEKLSTKTYDCEEDEILDKGEKLGD